MSTHLCPVCRRITPLDESYVDDVRILPDGTWQEIRIWTCTCSACQRFVSSWDECLPEPEDEEEETREEEAL